MTPDTQAMPSTPRRTQRGARPGAGLTIATAVLSGVLSWVWLTSDRTAPPDSLGPNISDLTEATDAELAGAVTTLNLPDAARDQFREAKDGGCRRPLAWVSLVSPPGAPPSRVRLISGTYYSPVFEVSATPVRVALPFPAPYEAGRGALTAIAVGGSATIALLPAWRVSAQDGQATRAVIWHPTKTCGARNG